MGKHLFPIEIELKIPLEPIVLDAAMRGKMYSRQQQHCLKKLGIVPFRLGALNTPVEEVDDSASVEREPVQKPSLKSLLVSREKTTQVVDYSNNKKTLVEKSQEKSEIHDSTYDWQVSAPKLLQDLRVIFPELQSQPGELKLNKELKWLVGASVESPSLTDGNIYSPVPDKMSAKDKAMVWQLLTQFG